MFIIQSLKRTPNIDHNLNSIGKLFVYRSYFPLIAPLNSKPWNEIQPQLQEYVQYRKAHPKSKDDFKLIFKTLQRKRLKIDDTAIEADDKLSILPSLLSDAFLSARTLEEFETTKSYLFDLMESDKSYLTRDHIFAFLLSSVKRKLFLESLNSIYLKKNFRLRLLTDVDTVRLTFLYHYFSIVKVQKPASPAVNKEYKEIIRETFERSGPGIEKDPFTNIIISALFYRSLRNSRFTNKNMKLLSLVQLYFEMANFNKDTNKEFQKLLGLLPDIQNGKRLQEGKDFLIKNQLSYICIFTALKTFKFIEADKIRRSFKLDLSSESLIEYANTYEAAAKIVGTDYDINKLISWYEVQLII